MKILAANNPFNYEEANSFSMYKYINERGILGTTYSIDLLLENTPIQSSCENLIVLPLRQMRIVSYAVYSLHDFKKRHENEVCDSLRKIQLYSNISMNVGHTME